MNSKPYFPTQFRFKEKRTLKRDLNPKHELLATVEPNSRRYGDCSSEAIDEENFDASLITPPFRAPLLFRIDDIARPLRNMAPLSLSLCKLLLKGLGRVYVARRRTLQFSGSAPVVVIVNDGATSFLDAVSLHVIFALLVLTGSNSFVWKSGPF